MKIFNIRDGFANNSSSTHSIVFVKDKSNISDNYGDDFGWDYFTAASENGILDYLRATLNCNIQYDINPEYVTCVIENWVGESSTPGTYGTVDHQSLISLPKTFDESGVDKEFFMEIKKLLLDHAIILGGNDNDDVIHPYSDKGHHANFLKEHSLVAKKDNVNNYWTLFNRKTGFKTRIVLNETGQETIIPKYASTPDLCDIKLTDFCSFGCNFCYQGSTKEGRHGDFGHIKSIINTLAENEVLEIAYGGGEPTTHPNFIDILKYTREQHIIPNFTTKNINWLKTNINDIADVIGSCAVSVDHGTTVNVIKTIRDFYNLPYHKICVQIVEGTLSEYIFKDIIKKCCECCIPVTILGYKPINRGSKYRKQDNSNWFQWVTEIVDDSCYARIGIDTKLVEDYEHVLQQNKVPSWLYHKEEGTFSWYIDAVNKTMGPSSYHPTEPYDAFYLDFDEKYRAYNNQIQ